MKYFHLGETRELEIIGHYPQTVRAINKGYNVTDYNSERMVKSDRFPDFQPHYGLDLNPESNDTDVLDKSTLPFGFVVSERLKLILEKFDLPAHRFYPINVYNTKKNYFWFHYIANIWNYIDFKTTEIEVFHKFQFHRVSIEKFSSYENAMGFKKSLPRKCAIRFHSIGLNPHFPKFDIFEITGIQYFTLISEKLKKELEREKITGIGIVEYNKIQVTD